MNRVADWLQLNWITVVPYQIRWMLELIWPELIIVGLSYPVGLWSGLGVGQMFVVTLLLIFQNMSFTIVSRARQSANLKLHAIAAIGSNGFFIFVIATVAANYGNLPLKLWYIVCTVVGSVHAHHISLHRIEKSKQFQKDSLVTRRDHDALALEVASLRERVDRAQPVGVPTAV